MTSLRIALWFNNANKNIEAFAKTASLDLQKCLHRFGVKGEISENAEGSEFDFCIILLSNSDVGSEFYSKLESIDPSFRIFAIAFEPIETLSISTKILNTYQYWDKIYSTGETRLFRRDNPETRINYWERLTDIATEISGISSKAEKQYKGTVYLSQNELSHGTERDNLVRDFNDLGYDALPNRPLSSNVSECTSQIESVLSSAQLIIHIIPPIYSSFFAHQHLSIAEHQCNVSANFVRENRSIPRIIWIPSSHDITDEENQVFIEKIQRDKDQTDQTTVLKSSIEDLKKLYRTILSNSNFVIETPKKPDVYLILDSKDDTSLGDCSEFFEKRKKRVVTNQNGITYNQHINHLALAKTVILSYNGSNERWLKVKTNDILKARGFDKYVPYENIVLLNKTNEDITSLPSIFTHILSNAYELESI